jgi:hypothetical protein
LAGRDFLRCVEGDESGELRLLVKPEGRSQVRKVEGAGGGHDRHCQGDAQVEGQVKKDELLQIARQRRKASLEIRRR